MHYVIYSKRAPDDTVTVPFDSLTATIDDWSGRPGIGRYIASGPLHRNGSAYVAAARGSRARNTFGTSGFIVEVRHDAA